MEEIVNVLFQRNKPFTPIRISGGTTNGRVKSQPQISVEKRLEVHERELYEDDIEYMRRELQENIRLADAEQDLTSGGQTDEVYKKYRFDERTQNATQLPVYASQGKILSKISEYSSVIIEGSTGCGKSTQIPQMILDEAKENGRRCNIVVTQPRRIAARNIAEQVCRERNWELGSLVGYQIGLDRKFVSEDTRLLYCTTGVLLEKLVQSKSLANYTHIVLDEVHERDKDMDFLFIVIKMLMAKEITNVRIVLMSATIDTTKFAEYFKVFRFTEFVPAPIIKIDKQGQFRVSEYYLDDLIPDINKIPELSYEHPGVHEDMYKITSRLIRNLDHESHKSASILIFLPGIYEIGRLHTTLSEEPESKKTNPWKIFILHSLISTEEQQSIFAPVEDGRKIILSTNIAESSITVPDVRYVIDFCLMKYLKNDSTMNCTRLEMAWASKNNCRQRSGRAGRVANGRCYRMVTHKFYECALPPTPLPEMLLTPLENMILKAKTFDMAAPHIMLGLAMDRPNMDDVANTVLMLKELGGMELKHGSEGRYSAIDGNLTFLGRVMASLPIDVRSTRLIIFGFCYGVLEDCIIMAAGLTTKSIFKITFEKSLREYSRRLEWSNGSGSDLFAILNAYKIWRLKYNQREFGASRNEQLRSEREFCSKHCLDVRSMNECHQLVQDLTKRLSKLGITEDHGKIRWTDPEKAIILKVVIAGAFYPNFFSTVPMTNPMIERDIFRTMNGRDPDNTVFFTGFRKDNIRELYVESIRDLFRNTVLNEEDIGCVKVSFDRDSEKVFVTFDVNQSIGDGNRNDWETKYCSIPGKTLTEVYKAVKMRKMGIRSHIATMNTEVEKVVAEKFGLGVATGCTFTMKEALRDDIKQICIPKASEIDVTGIITHVESCSKFWFQPISEKDMVDKFVEELNRPGQNLFRPCDDPVDLNRSMIVVARDHSNDSHPYHRARLINFNTDAMIFKGTVCFIDTGRTQKCELADLFVFNKDVLQAKMPPRSFSCRLAEVQPSTSNISGGYMWDREAIDLFNQLTQNRCVKAEIYSVVNGLVNVELWANKMSINAELVKKGFAERCEESFLSKDNRWKRKNVQNYMATNAASLSTLEMGDCDEYYPIVMADPVNALEDGKRDRIVTLAGPKSPLESDVYWSLINGPKNSIHIDAHSVNSVLLTPIQQDCSNKYMVAAQISQYGHSDQACTAHETTLLPSIRGFGPLMAMIFCPAMDLKRDKWKTRYISLRTGLGYDYDNNCPFFPAHDVQFPLDFELNESDLSMINQIRYFFDTLMYHFSEKTPNSANIAPVNKLEIMKKLKNVTLKLLKKDRRTIEINNVAHEWKDYYPQEYIEFSNIYGDRAIFPVHGLLKLQPRLEIDAKKQLWQHCGQLRNMTTVMQRPIMCELCKTELENVAILRTHLMSRLHMEREKQICFVYNDLNKII